MNNGTIITPLTPEENIEESNETPNDIYTPSDIPDNQIKIKKFNIKNFFKKLNCFEIVVLLFLFIIISSILTTIIIYFVYHIVQIFPIIYVLLSF